MANAIQKILAYFCFVFAFILILGVKEYSAKAVGVLFLLAGLELNRQPRNWREKR
jgi:hypothetical protein